MHTAAETRRGAAGKRMLKRKRTYYFTWSTTGENKVSVNLRIGKSKGEGRAPRKLKKSNTAKWQEKSEI